MIFSNFLGQGVLSDFYSLSEEEEEERSILSIFMNQLGMAPHCRQPGNEVA